MKDSALDKSLSDYLNLPLNENILKEIEKDKKMERGLKVITDYIFIPKNNDKDFWSKVNKFWNNLKNKDKFIIINNNIVKDKDWDETAILFIIRDKNEITFTKRDKNEEYFKKLSEKYGIIYDGTENNIN